MVWRCGWRVWGRFWEDGGSEGEDGFGSLDLGLGVGGFSSLEPLRSILLLVARCGEPMRMDSLNSGAVFFLGPGFSLVVAEVITR